MIEHIVVSDAGPLIALGKLDAVYLLGVLYNIVYASPIVFDETVTAGLTQSATDASLIKGSFDQKILVAAVVQHPSKLREPLKIHEGERESIQLAIQLRASEFLVDDSRARQVAAQNFSVHKLPTVIRGTLGIIYTSFQNGLLTQDQTVQLIESIKVRRDIWISAKLCDKVLRLIRTGSSPDSELPNHPTP